MKQIEDYYKRDGARLFHMDTYAGHYAKLKLCWQSSTAIALLLGLRRLGCDKHVATIIAQLMWRETVRAEKAHAETLALYIEKREAFRSYQLYWEAARSGALFGHGSDDAEIHYMEKRMALARLYAQLPPDEQRLFGSE